MRVIADLAVGGLATDVYLPDRTPAGAVVTRTPYDKGVHAAEGAGWSERGIAFVAQDVRGRYASSGRWHPYRHERVDGAALLDWLSSQPWFEGKAVLTGASYAAFTAWSAAIERPEHVAGVTSLVPAMGWDRVKFDPSGILRLAEHASWWIEHAEARTSRIGLAAKMFAAEPDLLEHLPVVEIADRMWADVPEWRDVVLAGPDAHSPEAVNDDELATLTIPTLHIGGWYDLLVPETLRQWEIVGSVHAPRPVRSLLVGPWGHELNPSIGRHQVDFAVACLAGKSPEPFTSVAILRSSAIAAWPAPGPSWRVGGGAGTATFRHDPSDPHPSRDPDADRSELDRREDVVRFRSAPIERPLTVMGEPCAHLEGTADARADWIVRIVERRADGSVFAIAEGAAVGAHGPFNLTLTATAYRATPGSTVEIQITGADFPRLARNLGTGHDRYTTSKTRSTQQTVDLGATWVDLPLREDA